MKSKEFYSRLMEAENLMIHEKYEQAITLLEELKQLEKEGDFEYELIHQLYQLSSNANSFYNQQIILGILNSNAFPHDPKFIDINELDEYLKKEASLDLDISTLKRELELLILRDLTTIHIEGNKIIL
jgi:hypothetical protein